MIAEVIVDISNHRVDRVFDYLAPKGTEIGCRVSVPFGNRRIEGYCIGLKETTDVPSDKLKSVEAILDDYPVVTEEMADIMRRLVAKYRWRKADVLRLFLPAQMRNDGVRPLRVRYATANRGIESEEAAEKTRRAPAQAELLEYLRAEGSCRTAELSRKFSPAALTALERKGLVTITKERLLRKPYASVTGVQSEDVTLTEAQERALSAVLNGGAGTYLLHGVTGSGKTEVYIRIILDCLARGKTAVMLVPEISLTPQMLRLFRARFGDRVAILHSGLSAGERFDEWTRLREGTAEIAIGARSAVFAPLSGLGAVIVDEEHDASYSSEQTPQYNTLEIARMRAERNECPLILGSATPDVETYWRAQRGEYTLLELPERINRRALPPIEIVDMTREVRAGNPSFLSRTLRDRLESCLLSGRQAILFLNRRGYASYQQCRSCGYVVKCDDCDVPMVYHRDEDRLKCHYCSARREPLTVCPECGATSIRQGSIGTERVASELMRLFPGVKVLRMDRDTTETKDAHEEILSAFRNHEADVLVGTQMVAKGHDFGECTLVGILEADLSLYASDFRAVERTYQLITQVAGRAGRAEHEGVVVLQTFSPRHYVFRYAAAGDYKGFYEREINLRETTKFPPFSTIVRIVVSGEEEMRAIDNLHQINDAVKALRDENPGAFAYAKSMRAPMRKLQSKYRVQMLVRLIGERRDEYVTRLCEIADRYRDDRLTTVVEVDPQNLR